MSPRSTWCRRSLPSVSPERLRRRPRSRRPPAARLLHLGLTLDSRVLGLGGHVLATLGAELGLRLVGAEDRLRLRRAELGLELGRLLVAVPRRSPISLLDRGGGGRVLVRLSRGRGAGADRSGGGVRGRGPRAGRRVAGPAGGVGFGTYGAVGRAACQSASELPSSLRATMAAMPPMARTMASRFSQLPLLLRPARLALSSDEAPCPVRWLRRRPERQRPRRAPRRASAGRRPSWSSPPPPPAAPCPARPRAPARTSPPRRGPPGRCCCLALFAYGSDGLTHLLGVRADPVADDVGGVLGVRADVSTACCAYGATFSLACCAYGPTASAAWCASGPPSPRPR